METIYKKVLVSERLPEKEGDHFVYSKYLGENGELKKHCSWFNGKEFSFIDPEYWLEEQPSRLPQEQKPQYGDVLKPGTLTRVGKVLSENNGLYIIQTDERGSTYEYEYAQLFPLPPQEQKSPERLKEAAMPLIKLLSENYHPHHTAIITGTSVELLEGIMNIPKIYDFVKD